jgi:hypothetical protein
MLLETVIYLYHSMDEANEGVSSGGAGFLVLVESEQHKPRNHLYAVTNKHVVDEGATVVRVNTVDGKTEAIPLARNQWIDHDDSDLSMAQIEGLHFSVHQIKGIHNTLFLTKPITELMKLSAGDDVFMVGRFVSHDGKQRNQPFVQSGIISLMPTDVETEWDEDGNVTKTEELFLVEMRSLSGCSGSPVLFEPPLMSDTHERLTLENRELLLRKWLVGVDCGHFKTHEKVMEVKRLRGGKKVYDKTSYEAESNAGQMMVVPAWKIQDLLDSPRFIMARKQVDEV